MYKTTSVLVTDRNDYDLNNILAAISTQDDLQIIGVENDETGTIIKTERLKPDILIMDLQPPGMDGLELAPIIHRRSPLTSIIMICERDENDYLIKALTAGIAGIMLKKTDMNKLIPAIQIVILGGLYVSAPIIKKALEPFSLTRHFPYQVIEINRQHDLKKNPPALSPTERGIILYIAQGYSDEETASHLNLSAGTIKNCVTAIKRKTKMKNRMQIVIYSLVNGLIKLEHFNIFKTDYYQNQRYLE